MKALVIGGGIGGLASAIGLRRVGWDVEVFERATRLDEVGAGISLWRNALAALDRLGVSAALKGLGVEGQTGAFRAPDGSILLDMKAGPIDTSREGVILLLHRAELLGVLIDALGRDSVRTDARLVGFEQDADGVTARFADGREARGDVLLGADGLRSTVRAALFGAEPPRYGGYTAWRAVVEFDPSRLVPGETWGRGRRFGQWGMTGGRAYWYATQTVPEGGGDPPRGRKRGLLDLFDGWHEPIADLIRATDESAILRNDVYDRPPLRRWSDGRVALLGDAAHPMTPDMGQGACQAIEDAVALADALAQVGPAEVPAALRSYESRRIPRASRIVRASHQAGTIAQWSNPLACKLREALLRSRFVARKQAEQLAWMIEPT
ncbi:FAD-dependent monooxygenase [Paludisphaera soli]|uniref:FAD-dependent monooxygenase n=1 Tax=Paludisphaera soli TaxID=2712865 RepID=UPI0013EDBF74|nr:FAD-dependent monooxygenase [Paludisphaera soli]